MSTAVRTPASAGTATAAPASAKAPGTGTPAGSATAARLVRDPEVFGELAGQWDDLRRRSRSSTPFQSHAWLHSWWLSYGHPGRLRVVLVSRGGELVGAAPMMLTYTPLPTLVALGGDITDFSDVLLDDGDPDAAPALAGALHRVARGAVVDLREVRPGAAAERLYDAWAGPRRKLRDSVCLELPGVPMETLLERLPAPSAKRTRQKLRKIDKTGVTEHLVGPAEATAAVRTMLSLHELQWEGRGVTPEHLLPRFRAHLQRTVRKLVASGDAVLTEYRIGGETVASDISLSSADMVCGYLYGAHPRLRAARLDITTMLLRHDAAFAESSGRGTLSLLRGTEPYKLRWQPVPVPNQRFVLARREMAPGLALHTARILGRSAAAGLVRRYAARGGWTWRTRTTGRRSGSGRTAGGENRRTAG
ncbi:Acetyltransferase involved in cellulose biosynthesis, CelD/BcsL family [Streptomyces sp. WMMB 714]|uniref:GNAT family N-acetyltransferase n=1 Tax=Streptomyces sp. WMMB 714 TaxID=1286822 RepID=UPI0005F80FA8|nr:GNAT family N-acetyltransferase [Streptomyces sp. WMMB 714]SCK55938.1 Acetyltransferase involved in cellulose biosynthesis, CelD/BcsL family [Streptomyces sp. WMMB 714]